MTTTALGGPLLPLFETQKWTPMQNQDIKMIIGSTEQRNTDTKSMLLEVDMPGQETMIGDTKPAI